MNEIEENPLISDLKEGDLVIDSNSTPLFITTVRIERYDIGCDYVEIFCEPKDKDPVSLFTVLSKDGRVKSILRVPGNSNLAKLIALING